MERNTYMHDWQEQVISQLASLNKSSQETAVVLERLTGRLDNFDQRLKQQEATPQDWRATLTGYGGCIGQFVFAALSTIGLLISIVSIVLVIVHG